MENEVRQRLRMFLKGKQTANLADELGYKSSTLSSKLSGARGIDLAFLCVVLDHYSSLSAEWLLRGTGQMECGPSGADPELKAVCIDQAKEIYRLKMRLAELEGEKKLA
jgi:hypothetical protein